MGTCMLTGIRVCGKGVGCITEGREETVKEKGSLTCKQARPLH
jgi:hypothetical protein